MKTVDNFFAQTNFVEVGNKLLREIINENPDFQYNNTGIAAGCHYHRGVGRGGQAKPISM